MPNDSAHAFACRVCGYIGSDPPWGEDGQVPSFAICPCCGVEWGYEDLTPLGASKFRERWLQSGASWRDESARPSDWNLENQLKNVPPEFSIKY